MESPTEVDIAWAAGLFEGEGCVHLYRGRYVHLSLEMTDEDVVRRFAKIVGATVYGPYAPRGAGSRKLSWQAQICARPAAEVVFKAFSPYLGMRRKEKVNEVLCASKALW